MVLQVSAGAMQLLKSLCERMAPVWAHDRLRSVLQDRVRCFKDMPAQAKHGAKEGFDAPTRTASS